MTDATQSVPTAALETGGYSLTITRTFDAPRELVFSAWTEPQHLMRWFCPKDFTVLFAQVDLRVGGAWRSGMQSPAGEQYIHRGTFREIDAPGRLVMTHTWEQNDLEPVADTLLTIDFTEHEGRTTMTFTHAGLATAASRDSHHGGWSEAFTNLAGALAMPSGEDTTDREIAISRVIAAPRERVFDAFADHEHLRHWWGPDGFTLSTHHMEFRPGGVWRLTLHGPDGRDYKNRIVYRVIQKPELIICDHDNGGDETIDVGCGRKIITFEPAGEHGEQTRLTLRMIFRSVAERDRAEAEYGVVAGGVQTVARLAQQLAGPLPALTTVIASDREVRVVRAFNAARDHVFRAWTRPELIRQWMSCSEEWPITQCALDLRVGGAIRYVWKHTRTGKEMGLSGVFELVQRPERLVHTGLFDEDWTGGETRESTSFVERDGRTIVTSAIVYSSAEARDAAIATGMIDGMAGCYARLDALLQAGGEPADGRTIVIGREIAAPCERVWNAWTDPAEVAKWSGPRGFTCRVEAMDFRPGGAWRHVFIAPDGAEYPSVGVYQEIVPLQRIVTTDGFDAAGQEARHELPSGLVQSISLEPVGDGTRLTVRISHPTVGERQKHEAMGVIPGYESMLDCLEDHLAGRNTL